MWLRTALLTILLGTIISIPGNAKSKHHSSDKHKSKSSAPVEPVTRLIELSSSPRIYMIENFLSDYECDHLIENARPHLKRSTVVSSKDNGGEVHDARTSMGMFYQRSADPIIASIEQRIAELTMIPVEYGEGIQVLSYGIGAEYRPHFDYFDPKLPGSAACLIRGGQRVATLIMYLANTEEGGETIFPVAKVNVKPVKGNAVLFYNCTYDGKEDPLSLHGGAPVIKGEKWIATKWLRQSEFR